MIAFFMVFLSLSFPSLRNRLLRKWYQYLAGTYGNEEWTFMNFGYAPNGNPKEGVYLEERDANNRYGIYLYRHVVSGVNLRDLDVLEIGCGRGGGAEYIKRNLKPRTMVGVDFSEGAVAFCNQKHQIKGLSFKTADALSLPFQKESFDAAINVESSHCYDSMDVFLYQVMRVLREGGTLLLADFRPADKVEDLRQSIRDAGFLIIKEADITGNVYRSLTLDSDKKRTLISEAIHKPFVKPFCEFAATRGSRTYKRFERRELRYLSFVLKKAEIQKGSEKICLNEK